MKIHDADAYKMLEKYGIPIARWGIANNLDELNIIIENIGFPAILKIDSPEIIHKMSANCVKIVHNQYELADSFRLVINNAKKLTNKINGVIVQEFIDGIEAIIGAKYDEQFGHVIMFGSGGSYTEIINDISFRLIPIKKHDAIDMIKETNIYKIFEKNSINIDKIADILMIVSIMSKKENIKELDINPLFVSKERIVAVDVRIIV